MSFRFVLLLVYLAYALSSSNLNKQGSGADPLGHSAPTPPPPTVESGGGLNPWG